MAAVPSRNWRAMMAKAANSSDSEGCGGVFGLAGGGGFIAFV